MFGRELHTGVGDLDPLMVPVSAPSPPIQFRCKHGPGEHNGLFPVHTCNMKLDTGTFGEHRIKTLDSSWCRFSPFPFPGVSSKSRRLETFGKVVVKLLLIV